jgi:simple sugar transport system permease protein
VRFSSSKYLLVYLAFLLVPTAWFVLNKTTLGLKIRAVGENPEAADSLGVSVVGVRYFTVILGGILSSVAGAALSVALLNVFQQNMTAGQGFIAVALVYFGSENFWYPGGACCSACQALRMDTGDWASRFPVIWPVMMPYV